MDDDLRGRDMPGLKRQAHSPKCGANPNLSPTPNPNPNQAHSLKCGAAMMGAMELSGAAALL